MFDLTGFQRDLLYTIAGKEGQHGLAIKDELEQYYECEALLKSSESYIFNL